MRPQELTTLALRVLAIFIASQAFLGLAQFASFWLVPPENQNVTYTALSLVTLLAPTVVAILIWLLAPLISRFAARSIPNDPIAGFHAQSAVSAAFVVAGTFIFIVALPNLVGSITLFFGPPAGFFLPNLIQALFKCVLGVVLVVGSRTTSKFLLRLRYAGTNA